MYYMNQENSGLQGIFYIYKQILLSSLLVNILQFINESSSFLEI